MKELKKNVEDALEEPVVSAKLLFKDYDNWDSLTGMVLMDMIETTFNLSLSVEELETMSFSELEKQIEL